MEWVQVKVKIDAGDIDAAADICSMAADGGIYIEDYRDLEREAMEIAHIDLIDEELLDRDRTVGYIHTYFSESESPAERVALMRELLTAAKIPFTIETDVCRNEDWENNWKKYFKPLKTGEKLVIRPLWETELPEGCENRKVLNIEPGLAFGTGGHDTTRLCLEALEKHIAPGCTMLDLGCGSGILAIAALLLGARSAVGVDIDELAVKTARENGAENGFHEPELTILHGDLTEKVHGKFDVIAANIVADAIILLSENARDFLAEGGSYIVSGIIDSREQDVLDALDRCGFEVTNRSQSANWICLECRAR